MLFIIWKQKDFKQLSQNYFQKNPTQICDDVLPMQAAVSALKCVSTGGASSQSSDFSPSGKKNKKKLLLFFFFFYKITE